VTYPSDTLLRVVKTILKTHKFHSETS